MDAPLIGRTLGHFRVTGAIGAGGMGVVYKATDLRLRRTVALKVLPPELALDSQRRARLLGEARAASALNHPHIVTVHEIDSADGTDFIAMEYVEGRPLDRVIGKDGLALAEALAYGAQIAKALEAAHAQGVVHRDLKPANVIVTPQGRLKVVDFGLAKLLPRAPLVSEASTETAAVRTAEGSLAGTLAYMSPEQAQGRPIDERSDLFSLGVIVYEMVTGRRPFLGDSLAALLSSILRDEPPPVRTLRPGLPAALDAVLAKALAKPVDERYASASELARDLEQLARSPAAAAARAPRGRGRVVVAVATLVLVAAAGFLWYRGRPRAQRPLRVRLLSTFPGSHRAPSLSPDGKMVAFVDTARGVPQIWLKYLGEGEPVQVTSGDVPAGRPRFSPRGDQILFERRRAGIWSVPPLGGTARRIVEAGTCASFFPDGDRIVFDKGTELWTARLDGSDAREVTGVQENFFSFYVQHCASVSPDGRSLAYFQPERGPHGDVWLIPAAGGEPRRLTHDVVPAGNPVFSRDGASVIFSSPRAGSRTLWRVALAGGIPEPVTTGAGEDDEPDLSGDGTKLVYTNSRHSFSLKVTDSASGAQREVLERRGLVNGAVFSPDGKRLAFFAWTDEFEQIFVVGADGSGLRQITRAGAPSIMPRWSPDGATLFFFQEEPPSFCRVPVSGGPVTELIKGWRWGSILGAWIDPSGTRVAYTLRQAGAPYSARVRDLASGSESDVGASMLVDRWSADGKVIAGHTSEDRVLLCPAEGGPCPAVAQGNHARWSGDGRRLFLGRRGRRSFDDPRLWSADVWSVAADGTGERRVTTLEPLHVLTTPFDVSIRDEIAWVEFRRGKEELWLAELDTR
jgi:Tol biopolymer transport system component/predicted Ser/Thr protein kinase